MTSCLHPLKKLWVLGVGWENVNTLNMFVYKYKLTKPTYCNYTSTEYKQFYLAEFWISKVEFG